MKERPILFSGEMVRAILEGRKTQTRRVMNPQPCLQKSKDGGRNWWCLDRSRSGYGSQVGNSAWDEGSEPYILHFPYGQPGDRLWVREAFQPLFADGVKFRDTDWQTGKGYAIRYVATDGRTEWLDQDDNMTDRCKPGIHMPRWASRITLEIIKVRVERVQEISEADAIAEGCEAEPITQQDVDNLKISDAHPDIKKLGELLGPGHFTAKHAYSGLWDKINSDRGYGWGTNPWVWVLSFVRVAEAKPLPVPPPGN